MSEEVWGNLCLQKERHCHSGGGQCRLLEVPEARGMCHDVAAAAVRLYECVASGVLSEVREGIMCGAPEHDHTQVQHWRPGCRAHKNGIVKAPL